MLKNNRVHSGTCKRILTAILVVCFLFQSIPMVGYADDADVDIPLSIGQSSAEKEKPQTEPDEDEADQDIVPQTPAPPQYIEKIEIATDEELYALAERVNSGDSMKDMLVSLKADIVLDAAVPWVPIGKTADTSFQGTFDGEDHSIANIFVEAGVQGGLFGYLYEATVQNTYLKSVKAADSVNGLYFFATRSTILDCKKKWGPFGLFSSGIALFGADTVIDWTTGARDTTWSVTPLDKTIIINSPEEFAQFAFLCNTDPTFNGFEGVTVLLGNSFDLENVITPTWTTIGNASTNPFKGKFYGMGCRIIGMNVTANGGLFGYIEDGSVNNLIIEEANVNVDYTGIAVKNAKNASIYGIVVESSRISGAEVAGICHTAEEPSGTSSAISQCIVYDTKILGTTDASGIVHENASYAVTQCAVYGGEIAASAGVASGIVQISIAPNSTYSSVNQNIVLGTEFSGSEISGILYDYEGSDMGLAYVAVGNNFVSDVDMPEIIADNYLGTSAEPYGVDYMFTDSPLKLNLVTTDALDYVINCFWDKSVAPDRTPLPQGGSAAVTSVSGVGSTVDFTTGHGAYHTSYLTTGDWVPNGVYWQGKTDYYPQLKYMVNSNIKHAGEIAGLVSVAVLLDNPEATLGDTKEIRLVKQTATGDALAWSYDDGGGWTSVTGAGSPFQKKDDTSSDFILWVKDDVSFDLKAETATGMVKTFKGITLKDSFLEEGVKSPTDAVMNASLLPKNTVFSVTYQLEEVQLNPNARKMIQLFWLPDGHTDYSLDKAMGAGTGNMTIIPVGGTEYRLEFQNLNLKDGTQYKLVIPAGSIEDVDAMGNGKGNFNKDDIVFEFTTESLETPRITTPSLDRSVSTDFALSWSDVESWFTIENYFDGATPSYVTSVVSDPKATLNSLAPGVYYYMDGALLATPRTQGITMVHCFVVTTQGKSARASVAVSVDGQPQWDPTALPPVISHINWTSEENTLRAIVASGARATYTTAKGALRNAPIEVEVDAADWAVAMASPGEPAKVRVNCYMVDSTGARITSDSRQTLVYMDKVLEYDFNTGALRITWEKRTPDEWKERVEEEIDFRALNFAPTADIKYDHGSNDYNENKVYTVKLTTAKQVVTLCPGDPTGPYPCSAENHKHLKDKVELKFTVKIVSAKAQEEYEFWQKIEDELFVPEFSEFNSAVERRPQLTIPEEFPKFEMDNYFEMPVSIIEALRVQPYNTLDLHYSAYQWKFYGHALEALSGKQQLYPLKVVTQDVGKTPLRGKIGANTPAVMVHFDYTGFLHGEVAFSYDLRLAGGLTQEQIDSTDFYLYRYNPRTNQLIPVADVLVDEKGWASAVLTHIQDEDYVFTDDKFGGEKYTGYIGMGASREEDWEQELYYKGANRFAAELDMFEQNPSSNVEITTATGSGDQTAAVALTDTAATAHSDSQNTLDAGNKMVLPIAALLGAVAVAGAVVATLQYKKRKGA